MENLRIKKKEGSLFLYPDIDFDAETGICIIEGESFMEDTHEFFDPIFDWISKYKESIYFEQINMQINLSYYNTSSSKLLSELLLFLLQIKNEGKNVRIQWFYSLDNTEMEDDIYDLSTETGCPIEMIAI